MAAKIQIILHINQIKIHSMKRMFLAFASALLWVACSQKQEMTIHGQVDPALGIDSAEVTLFVQGTDTVIKNTVTLTDNAFTLTQTVEKSQVTRLLVNGLGRYNICLEPGVVEFVVTANPDTTSEVAALISCTGTPNNDLLDTYNQAENEAMQAFLAANSEAESKAAEEAYINMTYDFILAHINTLASTAIFADASYYLSLDQVGSILELLNEDNLQYGRIPRVQASYEAMVKTKVGEPYTDFALLTPDGADLALSSLVGQTDYVLVDFWASWCGPCRRAMPALKEIYDANRGKLEILGVSLDDNRENWLGAIEQLGLNWKHISDLQGWKCAAGQLYGVSAIPSTVLIDKDGIIVGRNLSESEILSFLNGAQ